MNPAEPVPIGGGQFWSHDIVSTLFADYWTGNRIPLPSAAIVNLMTDFGITERGTRAALRKLVERGILTPSKAGRTTHYELTPWGTEAQRRGIDLAITFGTRARLWDGQWTIAMYALPGATGSERNLARRQLRELGFGMLHPGVWVSPRGNPDEVWHVLERYPEVSASVLRADDATFGEPLSRAWQLDAIVDRYQAFIAQYQDIAIAAERGELSDQEALVARAEVMNSWRLHKEHDPDLPEIREVTQARDQARLLFTRIYNTLRSQATARFRMHLTGANPALGDQISTFDVA